MDGLIPLNHRYKMIQTFDRKSTTAMASTPEFQAGNHSNGRAALSLLAKKQ